MSGRLEVMKTYKLYINGAFPRTESGRSYEVTSKSGEFLANACLASRKDLRDAVVAARAAQPGWAKATAFNRGQIMYRIAEMLEGRADQFAQEISLQTGVSAKVSMQEVIDAVDLLVWYAGWSDKLPSLAGATNPVSGPYYNFTVPEALGVVGVIATIEKPLLGLIEAIAPVLVSGNTAVVLASSSAPLSAISFAEVLATSDLPNGVLNILSGQQSELAPWFASHMDIDGLDISGLPEADRAAVKEAGVENLKRISAFTKTAEPGRILAFMEAKTIWHPIGN
ncbi:MAG: aldehyde dehydrogenase family protein [Candidatus Nanopelagicaceae bacterium]|nr:aldehyde dehydrogenase family protein [Candidatus Nanopelagicaceae bacterium]